MKNKFLLLVASVVLITIGAARIYATSGNCTLGAKWATIETGSTQYVATLTGQPGTITNVGAVDIEIGWNSQAIGTAGTQVDGQITLKVGMTVPVRTGVMTTFSFKSASASQIDWVPY